MRRLQRAERTSLRPVPMKQSNTPYGGDDDCEDQGFTRLEDGCPACRMHFVKRKSPSNASMTRGGPWYWYCEGCKGYFGEVQ